MKIATRGRGAGGRGRGRGRERGGRGRGSHSGRVVKDAFQRHLIKRKQEKIHGAQLHKQLVRARAEHAEYLKAPAEIQSLFAQSDDDDNEEAAAIAEKKRAGEFDYSAAAGFTSSGSESEQEDEEPAADTKAASSRTERRRKPNPFEKVLAEAQKCKQQQAAAQPRRPREEVEREIAKKKRARRSLHYKLSAKNARGQPVFSHKINHLLGKIKAGREA